jgi:tetratricopeptide (TPR) repeat protein
MRPEPITIVYKRLPKVLLASAIIACALSPIHAASAEDPSPIDNLQLAPAASNDAPAKINLIGKCVVPQAGKFRLRDDHQVVLDDGSEFRLFRVEKVDGDRLRLHAIQSSLTGWAMAEDVVVVDEPNQPPPPPPAPRVISPALRDFNQLPEHIFPKKDEENSQNRWETAVSLAPRDVVESFKNMFSGKSDVAYDLMIANFTETIHANPQSASTYYLRGMARSQRKDYDNAIADFNKALELNPRDAQTYCVRGTTWAEKKRYDKAIADFTEAIKIDPLRADAYYDRGYAHFSLKQWDNAIADLTEVIRLMPNSALAYRGRGASWQRKGEPDKALADYSELIRIEPDRAEFYVQRGTAWGSKRDDDRAIRDFDEAIRIDPENSDAYYYRAISWCAKDQFDKGLADLNRALELHPKLPHAHATRGQIWCIKKEFANALADFEEAIRQQPTDATLYEGRAHVQQRLHAYDKAIADYTEAINIEPKNPIFHNNLAWLCCTCPDAKYRDGKKAIAFASKACQLTDWKEPGNLDTLAAAYAETGDFPSAIKWQSRAMELIKDEKEKADYRPRLELYKAKQPYHESAP